jgi:hypothetical protein
MEFLLPFGLAVSRIIPKTSKDEKISDEPNPPIFH